jgi:hypothetical protein
VRLDIIAPDEQVSSSTSKEICKMKKLFTLMLGMTFLFTTVAVVFAQDTTKKEDTSKKKSKKKKTDTTKKDGR